jgi:hypothetical protein
VKRDFLVERNGRSFVLYAGLLDLAHERGLKGITTTLVQIPSELNGNMAICHATIETEHGTFTGLGDASPVNVSRMMEPHLIRMAETRAKARALRDAVNVGVTALEELADVDESENDSGGGRIADGEAMTARRHGSQSRSGSQEGVVRHGLRALEAVDVVGPEESRSIDHTDREPGVTSPASVPHEANGQAPATLRPAAAPATAKQLQTIQRMARASGKTITAEGLTRAQASEIISHLIGEMDQQRAS